MTLALVLLLALVTLAAIAAALVAAIEHRRIARLGHELAERNEALRRLNDVKTEFLAAAAHDLKNPLGVVIGLSEILVEELDPLREREPALVAELTARAAAIRTSAEHMSTLVGQLLDTVALESGQVRLRRQEVDLARLAATVAEAHRARAAAKDIALEVEVDGACPAHVDPDRAWEIVDNLVSNAVKFSPRGRRVWVRARSGAAGARVEVEDEGPGLTASDRERVFGRFQRLSARPTAGESSTGLGLSIVKNLVELHGGTIAIEGAPGAGARFVVDLPRAATPPSG